MEGDGDLSNRQEPGAADALGTNRNTPVKCCKGIRACSSKKVTRQQPSWSASIPRHTTWINRSWKPLCS